MRKGFTLVELIFTIVIIGILAAVAVPKFGDLKQNAELSNVNNAISGLVRSGKSAYMNEIELNGKTADNLALVDIFEFSGKGWGDDDDSTAWYSSADYNITFEYVPSDSHVVVAVRPIDDSNVSNIVTKIKNQTGVDFNETYESADAAYIKLR